TAAPQNLYQTEGIDEFGRADCWVAIAVATDDHWVRLREAIGNPAWAMSPDLVCHDGRRDHHDLIDKHLAAWCAKQSADEIVTRLWDAGVPVAKVMQPHRQTELPQLAFRRFFEDVAHPVNDVAPHSTLPMRFSAGPRRVHQRHAPLLGEHNREVLTELGLTDSEIDELEAEGVIGRTLAM
ncbi:MAG TPA: CoA transferase, partial [Mycobacterium sp.]|nr:CoA transferase [Mycobacterium sp.]